MKQKKGQFFLISAVVIIAVIVSIVTISNYIQKKDTIKLYDLGEELGIESQQVLDFGTYSELNETQMKTLMENFIQNYVNYIEEDKNIYFIFGNRQKINVIGYQELTSEEVCIKLNPETPECGDGIVNEKNEQCDDGNEDRRDGCRYCMLEEGCSGITYSRSFSGFPIFGDNDGNNKLCEGENLNGKTCADLGFASGVLKCTSKCGFDVSSCVKKEETECIPLQVKGETEEFPATNGDIYKVVIRIGDIEYEFKLKGGENFYFVIWQKVGGEKHVVTN